MTYTGDLPYLETGTIIGFTLVGGSMTPQERGQQAKTPDKHQAENNGARWKPVSLHTTGV